MKILAMILTVILAILATGCDDIEPLYFTPTPTSVSTLPVTSTPVNTGKIASSSQENTGKNTGKIVTGVDGGRVYLRECASMRCIPLTILSEGQRVEILAIDGGWYKVVAGSYTGWVAQRLVQVDDGQ